MDELHKAAARGDLERVRELIKRRADVNARDKDGRTPLHHAAYNGRLEVARLLVERGADVNARDKNGWTPLDIARERGCLEVARLLESAARWRPSKVEEYLAKLEKLYREGMVSEEVYRRLKEEYERERLRGLN